MSTAYLGEQHLFSQRGGSSLLVQWLRPKGDRNTFPLWVLGNKGKNNVGVVSFSPTLQISTVEMYCSSPKANCLLQLHECCSSPSFFFQLSFLYRDKEVGNYIDDKGCAGVVSKHSKSKCQYNSQCMSDATQLVKWWCVFPVLACRRCCCGWFPRWINERTYMVNMYYVWCEICLVVGESQIDTRIFDGWHSPHSP